MTDEEILQLAYEKDMEIDFGDKIKEQFKMKYQDEEFKLEKIDSIRYYMNVKGMTIGEALDYLEPFCEYIIRTKGKEYIYFEYCRNCEHRLRDCSYL